MPSRAHALIISILFCTLLTTSLPAAAADSWPHRSAFRDEIRFWKEIFVTHDENSFVLHDPEDLSLVYRVISLRPNDSAAQRRQRLKAARYEVENTLRSLAEKISGNGELTRQEARLKALFGGSVTPLRLKRCASRIRVQQGIANRFYDGLQRSAMYIPAIRKVFRDRGLPEDLAYLPHVESSFDLTARSKAGAAGMWQFMKPTARIFSLRMDRIVDERYDPLAASEAAAALLKKNYDVLGDWGLALTAYNYGLAGMAKAKKRHGDYPSVRKHYSNKRFKFASKNFYPEFLAVLEIVKEPARYFPRYAHPKQQRIVQHRLHKPATLPALAKTWGLDLPRLRELNPGYSRMAWDGRLTIPRGYAVNIPETKAYTDPVPVQVAQRAAPEKAVAGIAPAQPADAPLVRAAPKPEQARTPKAAKPEAGKPLPAGVLSAETLGRELAPVLAVKNGTIRVFANETLSHYARWLKVSPKSLCRMNKISARHNLQQQQELRLDFSRISPDMFARTRLNHHLDSVRSLLRQHNIDQLVQYRLGRRDSLPKLASQQFKIPSSLIVYFNADQDLNSLPPGSVLRIPVSRESSGENL